MNAGPFEPLVRAVGFLTTAAAAITFSWRRRTEWEPSEEDIPKGPIRVSGLLTAIAIGLLWTVFYDKNTERSLEILSACLAIGTLVSLLGYGFLSSVYTFSREKKRGARKNDKRQVIGGFRLTEMALKDISRDQITTQEYLAKCAYDIDRVWTRGSRAATRQCFAAVYICLTVWGSTALAATALLVLHDSRLSNNSNFGVARIGMKVRLTSEDGLASSPQLSPDGQRIVFSWARPTTNPQSEIYVTENRPNAAVQITFPKERESDVSPIWLNDSKLAFVRQTRLGNLVETVKSSGGETFLLAETRSSHLSASYDGRHLITIDLCPSGELTICEIDTTSGDKRPLLAKAELVSDSGKFTLSPESDPVLSPDEEQIAFVALPEPAAKDLFLLDIRSSRVRRISSEGFDINGFSWYPDGHNLVVSSNRSGKPVLWKWPLNGGSPTALVDLEGEAQHPFLRSVPPGESYRLVFEVTDARFGIDAAELGSGRSIGRHASMPSSSLPADVNPSFAQDSTRFVFVSNRSGALDVYRFDSDLSSWFRNTSLGTPQTSTHVLVNPDLRDGTVARALSTCVEVSRVVARRRHAVNLRVD